MGHTPNDRSNRGRPAFSFVEVLFAVVLLGLGFILVAAMLPVAAVQNQETMDQTVGAQVAKSANEALASMAANDTLPYTSYPDTVAFIGYGYDRPPVYPVGAVAPFQEWLNTNLTGADVSPRADRAWQLAKGRMIHAADARYAWTAAYARQQVSSYGGIPYAHLFVIVSRSRTRDVYTEADVRGARPNLRLREAYVYLTEGTNWRTGVAAPDLIQFVKPNYGPYNGIDTPAAVAEGTFVIIADDQQMAEVTLPNTTQRTKAKGFGNGRAYRVGNPRPDKGLNYWELMPGWDMVSGKGAGGPGDDLAIYTDDDNQNIPVQSGARFPIPAKAIFLGRASVDASDAREFEGPAQDVALFSTYIPITR